MVVALSIYKREFNENKQNIRYSNLFSIVTTIYMPIIYQLETSFQQQHILQRHL